MKLGASSNDKSGNYGLSSYFSSTSSASTSTSSSSSSSSGFELSFQFSSWQTLQAALDLDQSQQGADGFNLTRIGNMKIGNVEIKADDMGIGMSIEKSKSKLKRPDMETIFNGTFNPKSRDLEWCSQGEYELSFLGSSIIES